MIVYRYAAALRRSRCFVSTASFHRFAAMALKPALLAGLLLAAGCAHTPPVPSADWSYPEGPSWGPQCLAAAPPQQSPIDLTQVRATPLSVSVVLNQAAFNPHDQNVAFAPARGPVLMLDAEGDESGISGSYTVAGFHFHDGHEHVIGGDTTLELHIKTVDSRGGTAVFGVLWKPVVDAAPDALLVAAQRSLTTQLGTPVAVDVGDILQRFGRQPFYSYVGSLTTPPCSPNIRWFVLQTALTTSPASISQLVAALQARGMPAHNVRAIKPLAQPQPPIYRVTPRQQ